MSKSLIGRLMLDLEGMSLSKEENEILLNPHVGGVILFTKNISSSVFQYSERNLNSTETNDTSAESPGSQL